MRLPLLLTTLLLSTACQERGNFEIVDPYLKPPLAGRDVGSAYMRFENWAFDLELTEVTSPETDTIEIHKTTRDERGIASMNRLESLELPYGETLKLEPGGLHLMLFGLTEDEAEDGVELTLTFDNGTTQLVEVRARKD
jgi:copper(I)-binding protein